MTQGTPSTGESEPRLRLQTHTRTIPAMPTAAIVRIVMLNGGALRP